MLNLLTFTWFVVGILRSDAFHGKVRLDISPGLWLDVNHATQNEYPANISAKIGEELTIPCLMDYELTYFAWYLCRSDCPSSNPKWKIVVRIDNGSTTIFDENFGIDSNGSLVVKDILPENNTNWVRCFYKERWVGMEHRSTIIIIDLEAPTFTMKGVKEHHVFEGMPLFLDCGARGYPVPSIAWIWDDQVLQNSTDGPSYLLLRRVTTKEAGNYTCIVRNSLGEANYTYQVIVKVDEPTRESGTHSTDPIREDEQGSSSLAAGIGIGILIGVAVSIAAFCAYMYLSQYIRNKYVPCRTANLVHEEDLESEPGDNEGFDLQIDKI